MDGLIEKVAIISGMVLPLFNLPLVLKIRKTKSAKDFSLSWVIGVWTCMVFMLPQALRSPDPVFRAYGVMNLLFFSLVLLAVFKYRISEK